jgi:hypothetical protein
MAQLDLQIARSRRIIAQLTEQIVQQERLLRGLESWLGQIGLDSEEGRQARRALEEEISTKRITIESLKQLLDDELQRLLRLEDALRRRPHKGPPVPA